MFEYNKGGLISLWPMFESAHVELRGKSPWPKKHISKYRSGEILRNYFFDLLLGKPLIM